MAGLDVEAEWLEADGRGGFASGTVGGLRTRRYHALLLSALHPPAGHVVLVNGVEAWAEQDGGTVPLTSQRYAPDIVHHDARPLIAAFTIMPWPTWTLRLPGGAELRHEVLVDRGSGRTLLRWRRVAGHGACRLQVRPLLSGRGYHAMHHENPAFGFASRVQGAPGDISVAWQPYADLPAITATANAAFAAAPDWYRNFLYTAERDRGLDFIEDLVTPGVFTWDLAAGAAVLMLQAGEAPHAPAAEQATRIEASERSLRGAMVPPDGSVRSYLVGRAEGQTIVAGYPWFTDWGRDTFIALRGLLLATGRLAEAEQILLAWSGLVSEGMVPNRFPDDGGTPEYNAVDASLWFVVAAHDFLNAAPETPARAALQAAADLILQGYSQGTRFGIAADADGLLRAGVPGQQLTWMDAKVENWVVTPRTGKPVEVQALWINALRIGAAWRPGWNAQADLAEASFLARFPDPGTGGLADVVDVDGVPGQVDRRVRPNQIFAVGGLPFPLLTGDAARRVVDLVEARLLTPMGLRTLAPDDPAYVGRYAGDRVQRDGAYHQGTVWPWLTGPFVEAWLRVRGNSAAARAEADARFLGPLRAHLNVAGLGHVSEVADGDAPHAPGGCPFQAWSLGELLRAERLVAA